MSAQHNKNDGHQLFSVKLYVGVFFVLLTLIFANMGISRLPLSPFFMLIALLAVALIQFIILALFFMELLHEDKFFSFVFGSAILFMLLFFGVTLNEIGGRDFFNPEEDVRLLRGVDQNGAYAPQGPAKITTEQDE